MPNLSAASPEVYQLKITLLRIRPPVWRRVLIPATIRLDDLHEVIQAVMGWDNSHLHRFSIAGNEYSDPGLLGDADADDEFSTIDETRVRLNEVVHDLKASFDYEYDFGDSWAHRIVLEKILPSKTGQRVPWCVAGKRACPPEDCGGIWGYGELLLALANAEHPEHDDMVDWVGEDFDSEHFDAAEANARLHP